MWKRLPIIFLSLMSLNAIAPAQRRAEAVDLLISGATIVTMDAGRRVLEDGALAVKGGRIVAVGPRAEIAKQYAARETVNARRQVAIPGLINGHTHVPMSLFRGIVDDLDLDKWLTEYIFPAEARNVDEAFVRAGTRLGLAEMIRGGTTTYCDMYYFEDAIADETAKAGVRGVLGETIIDFPVADNKTHAEAMAYAERFVKKWQGHPLIVPALAPHAPYTVSTEHLKVIRALADKLRAPIVTHISETMKEVNDITAQKGMPPLKYLDGIGFLKNDVIAAHVVFPQDGEMDIILRTGLGVVHNPQSNMKLASGVAPVPEMLARNVNLGLGTDGAASNNDVNMWEEMDSAAKLHKVFSRDPKVVTAQDAFALATIGSARAVHLEKEIGSLEAGKRADIVLVDFDELNQTPFYNIYSALVYATKADDVRSVVIEGKFVMRDRRLLTLNEAQIKRDARAYREKISRSLATAGPKS
jgi:5-methylthioadenosine/S-adenosylhomocysteine deaminase